VHTRVNRDKFYEENRVLKRKKIYLDEFLLEDKESREQQKAETDKRVSQMGYKNMLCPNIIYNREFLDIERDTLLSFEYNSYIMCDRVNKEMFHAEYLMGTIYHTTTALLIKVSEKFAAILQKHFNIVLEEYGLTVISSEELVALRDGV